MEKNSKFKVLILASVASMIEQFNMNNIKILMELGYEVEVVANFIDAGTISIEKAEKLEKKLFEIGVRVYHVPIPRKISRLKKIIDSYTIVKKLCIKNKYKIIHCHSPIGGVIARLAAIDSRKNGTKLIYTAHGFHFYKGAPAKNWILYYPIEWFCYWITDILIVINHEDFIRAKNHMHAKRVEYIPGVGIDMDRFNLNLADVEKKRKLLGVKTDEFLFLSIGELNKNKNHEFVIKVIARLKNSKVKYFIAGEGDLKEDLIELVEKLDLESQIKLLGYRDDVEELYQVADLFVFPSKREGLPVALMEAIASRVPVVCSKIRGNSDLANKYMFDVSNEDSLVEILGELIKSREILHKTMAYSVDWNYEHLREFSLQNVSKHMRSIYLLNEI